MLVFILKRQNLFNDGLKKNNNQFYNNKLENLEIDIKKKVEKLSAFNPIHSFDELTQSDINSTLSLQNQQKQNNNFKSNLTDTNCNRRVFLINKINSYKKMQSLIEIFALIIILVGAFLSIAENNMYYNHNFEKRVVASILIHTFRNYKNIPSSITANELVEEYNLAAMLKKENNNINYSNEYILNSFNLKKDFNFTETIKDYNNISIELEETIMCSTLRLILLVTSLIASILVI